MTNESVIRVSFNINQSLTKQVDVLSSDSIADVKQKLTKALSADCTPQKLKVVFGGKILTDEQRVGELCLSSHSVLHAITDCSSPVEAVLSETADNPTSKESTYHYYVYCKVCDSVEPGKLRVKCRTSQDGGIVLKRGPNNWDDVLLQDRLSGYCLSCAKENFAQFYFKCASHEGSEIAVPLRHIRCNRKHVECITCTQENPVVLVYPCAAHHVICLDCFKLYCTISLENRKFLHSPEVGYSLPCPAGCDSSLIQDNHHFYVMGREKYEQYKDFGVEDYLLSTGGIICPNPGCGEGMVLDDNSGRSARCASCQFVFCVLCKSGQHEGDCVFSPTRGPHGELSAIDGDRHLRARWDSESLETIHDTTKPCPQCKTRTEKAGGCMHMQCTRCRLEWCWLCEKEWDRECQGNHWFG